MNICNTETLRKLQVINLRDGACLGYATDFEFDRNTACMTALVIPGSGGFFGIGKSENIVIPWCSIRRFGEDVILVDLKDAARPCFQGKKRGKRSAGCGEEPCDCE